MFLSVFPSEGALTLPLISCFAGAESEIISNTLKIVIEMHFFHTFF